jgi:hypothetical protein
MDGWMFATDELSDCRGFWLIGSGVAELSVSTEVKAVEDWRKLHARLSIDNPFKPAYDVGHVLGDSSFKRIHKALARACGILSRRSTEVLDGATTKETFAVLLEPVTKEQVV